jgi:hypothetical protein
VLGDDLAAAVVAAFFDQGADRGKVEDRRIVGDRDSAGSVIHIGMSDSGRV